ncbi:hypothetical protein ACU4GD_28060 [Cupriavidus basilensis]
MLAAALSRPFQGRLLKEWASNIEADRMVRIRDAIRIGFVEGQTTDQIIRRVRGTRAKGLFGRHHRDRSPARRFGGTHGCLAHGGGSAAGLL